MRFRRLRDLEPLPGAFTALGAPPPPDFNNPFGESEKRSGRSQYGVNVSGKRSVYREPGLQHPVREAHMGVIMDFGRSVEMPDLLARRSIAKFVCHGPECVIDELTMTFTGENLQQDPDTNVYVACSIDQIDEFGAPIVLSVTDRQSTYKATPLDTLTLPMFESRRVAQLGFRFVNPNQPMFVRWSLVGDTTTIAPLMQDMQVQTTMRLRMLYAL